MVQEFRKAFILRIRKLDSRDPRSACSRGSRGLIHSVLTVGRGSDSFGARQKDNLSSTSASMFRPSSSWRFGVPKADENWQDQLESVDAPVLDVICELVRPAQAFPLSYGLKLALRAMTQYADAVR
jgi:hypothetical protein